MSPSIWKSALTLGVLCSVPALGSEPQDQGPVILGMDDWVDDGTVEVSAGPWSGVSIAEQEPNDVGGTADAIEVGDNYEGELYPGSDLDLAALVVNEGDGVIFETNYEFGTLSDTTLSIVDIDGATVLAFDDDGGTKLMSRLEYFFAASGTYFIRVGSPGGETGTYQLAVRPLNDPVPTGGWAYIQKALESMAPAVFAPNDGSVAVVGSTNSVSTSADAGAAYHFAVPAAARSAPALSGVATFHNGVSEINEFFGDLALGNVRPAIIAFPGSGAGNSLTTNEGAALAANADGIADFIGLGGGLLSHGDDGNTNAAYAWLPTVFPGAIAGRFVTSPYLTDEGKFSLPGIQKTHIESGAHGFFLNHDLSVFVEAQGVPVPGPFSGRTVSEQEPNDDHTTANSVEVGDDFTGDITTGADLDDLVFEVSAGDRIVAETVSGGSLADTTLTLYSTDGTTQLEFDDDGGAGQLSRIEYSFSVAGLYYLEVGGFGTRTGSYLLELRELMPTPALDVVVGKIPGPWVWLGQPLAGLLGNPVLTGTGDLTTGSGFALDLNRARADSSALLLVGLWQRDLPFKGGLIVPNPGAVAAVATDATGAVTISGSLPSSSSPGATLFLQYWIRDAAGPQGWAASNGLSLTTQ